MKKYQFLAERYYKFFRYLRVVGLVSVIVFLVVTAFNRGNPTLSLISYIAILMTFACLLESVILYILYIIFKRK
ncbi:hypothetical protein NMU03_06350 [Allocoprobacillus halotolerans]|uniref:Uncharacterized protein n=1 Tax=Allocoprobacillus halotolerans TaxID=2944914 RepID=A0ABY5I6R3_9FIRM|nr:hypothetical protein [Allocoprobacillus halotolerans]UTY40398.1 hypothetical protein NMU03_06350 [Allocoprobacillus halotolerans]